MLNEFSGWFPIESAPKDKVILVYGYERVESEYGGFVSTVRDMHKVIYVDNRWEIIIYSNESCYYVEEPTHWAYLIDPPKERKTK